MLSVKKSWVYAAARSGELPSVPLGRYIRFRRESIERWIQDRECGTMGTPTKRPRAVDAAGGMA